MILMSRLFMVNQRRIGLWLGAVTELIQLTYEPKVIIFVMSDWNWTPNCDFSGCEKSFKIYVLEIIVLAYMICFIC